MTTSKHAVLLFLWIVLVCCASQSQGRRQQQLKSSPTHSTNNDTNSAKGATASFDPSPEMQKLLDAFDGQWTVSETFEMSSSRHGQTRQGNATLHAGPGVSLMEDYKSNGSAGELNFFALLWWDKSAQVYRVLTCANNSGCALRGTAQWEGSALVNSWREDVGGKTATFRDSFEDISPSGFHLVSEGSADGKTVWRVITEYKRINLKK
jgi:hypothetical protein